MTSLWDALFHNRVFSVKEFSNQKYTIGRINFYSGEKCHGKIGGIGMKYDIRIRRIHSGSAEEMERISIKGEVNNDLSIL